MGFCKNCGNQIPDGSLFCGKCGAKQEPPTQGRMCQNCGNELAQDLIFCDKCGTKYSQSVAAPPPMQQRPIQPPPMQQRPIQPPPMQQQPMQPPPMQMPYQPYPPVTPANTSKLNTLSIVCIFLFWPIAIYGFVCVSNAKKASSISEAEDIIKKGSTACTVGIVIGAILTLFNLIILAGM